MNNILKLSQLEVSLHFVQRQLDKFEWLANNLTDPSQREEARQEAQKKHLEAKEICRQIENLM